MRPTSRGTLPFRVLTTAGSACLRETAAPSDLLAPFPLATDSRSSHAWLMVSPRCCRLVTKPHDNGSTWREPLPELCGHRSRCSPGFVILWITASRGGPLQSLQSASSSTTLSPARRMPLVEFRCSSMFRDQNQYRFIGSAIPLRRSSGLEVFPVLVPSVRCRKTSDAHPPMSFRAPSEYPRT